MSITDAMSEVFPDYLDAIAADLTAKGWRAIWMVPGKDGLVPQIGSTGRNGVDLPRPANAVSLSIGCPSGVMMFDVDHGYPDKAGRIKRGADTLQELQLRLGKLPPTWRITSRDPGNPSGKLPYRIRPGVELHTSAGTDVDIIQRHHRFTWAPGTLHPKTNTIVQVYSASGIVCALPYVGQLPGMS
jgi:hypothetical protein